MTPGHAATDSYNVILVSFYHTVLHQPTMHTCPFCLLNMLTKMLVAHVGPSRESSVPKFCKLQPLQFRTSLGGYPAKCKANMFNLHKNVNFVFWSHDSGIGYQQKNKIVKHRKWIKKKPQADE